MKKRFRPNWMISQEFKNFETHVWPWFSQKITFFYFSLNIFWLVRRMALIFLLLERLKSGEPSRYLDHGRGIRKNFLRAVQIKFQLQKNGVWHKFRKIRFKHAFRNFWILDESSNFVETFFSSLPREFFSGDINTIYMFRGCVLMWSFQRTSIYDHRTKRKNYFQKKLPSPKNGLFWGGSVLIENPMAFPIWG